MKNKILKILLGQTLSIMWILWTVYLFYSIPYNGSSISDLRIFVHVVIFLAIISASLPLTLWLIKRK